MPSTRLKPDGTISGAAPEAVRQEFDALAPRYDNLTHASRYFANGALLQLFHRHINRTGLDILDLGCGTGQSGELFRRSARKLVGVDISPEMLKQAAAKRVYDDLRLADISQPIDGTYDLILAAGVLPLVPDVGVVFGHCRTALRPGGSLLFTTMPGDVQTLLGAAGFVLTAMETTVIALDWADMSPVPGLAVLAQGPR